MGIFDNLFKNKEEVVAPAAVVNENIYIYDRIKTLVKENKEVNQNDITNLICYNIIREKNSLFKFKMEEKLAGVDVIKIKENKEDLINFVLKIPLEYRPFKDLTYKVDYFSPITSINNRFDETMNNEFLVINDITEAQKVKLDSMLDGFKNKLGTEWLLGFVDFMKEIDNMNLNKKSIKDKSFSSNLEENVFKSERPIINAYKILEDATTLYINGTQLNTTFENKFNKGDYIIEDNFGKFINVSKEDFEAKYKVIEKKSLDNIKDPSYSFDYAKNINVSKEDFEATDTEGLKAAKEWLKAKEIEKILKTFFPTNTVSLKEIEESLKEVNVSKEDFEAKYKEIEKILKTFFPTSTVSLKEIEESLKEVDGSKISTQSEQALLVRKDNHLLKNNEFNNLVNETNKTISNKDDELNLLKEELNKMNIEMEQLKEKVNNLENKSFFRNM